MWLRQVPMLLKLVMPKFNMIGKGCEDEDQKKRPKIAV